MLMFTSLVTLLVAASAVPYGSGYGAGYGLGLGAGYGLGLVGHRSLVSSGLVGGLALGAPAIAPLAVQTGHQVHYRNVPSGGFVNPVNVDIDANVVPINLLFRSASSPINVQQSHIGARGSIQESASQDEEHILRHSVVKPVIQEIREIVTPMRHIQQEILPVREQINTLVARGVNQASAVPATGLISGPATLGNGIADNGLVGTGLVGNGLVGNGLVGNGLVGNGLVGNGLVGNGLVGNGLVGNGLVGNSFAGNGLVGGSIISRPIMAKKALGGLAY